MLRKVMLPKGYVVHYAKDIPGFQKIKTLCGKVMDFDYFGENFSDRGEKKSCKTCLTKKFLEEDPGGNMAYQIEGTNPVFSREETTTVTEEKEINISGGGYTAHISFTDGELDAIRIRDADSTSDKNWYFGKKYEVLALRDILNEALKELEE